MVFLQMMQSSCTTFYRNIMSLTAKKPFLRPHQSTHVTLVAGAKRGPPRYFGYTKSQFFDTLMKSNATIMAGVSSFTLPIVGFMMWRYNYVKKEVEEHKKIKEDELLSEGAFQKS